MTNPTAHGVSVFDGLVDAPSDLSAAIARVRAHIAGESSVILPGDIPAVCAAAERAAAQELVVPLYRGYAALGTGQYVINHSRAGEPAELVISIASEDDKRGRQIGESRDNPPDAPPIQPDEMVVRIAFTSERGLFALEDQLAWVRRVHFPSTSSGGTPCESPDPCTDARLTSLTGSSPAGERSDGAATNRSHSATAAHPTPAQAEPQPVSVSYELPAHAEPQPDLAAPAKPRK